MRRFVWVFLLLAGCNSCPERVPPFTMETFSGRDEVVSEQLIVRRLVYRAKVPRAWTKIESDGSLLDTRLPNVSFQIDDALTLTVHTFPSDDLESRIPVAAQVERWKRQHAGSKIEPTTHGGFAGLKLEAPTCLAWSMQLDMEHYQTLHFLAENPAEREHFKQMSADYTIKASGSAAQLDAHRAEIALFARSFELIQPIPKR